MADAFHGYNVSVGYSAHFIREVAPDWMRFCTRAHGFEPPRTGRSYRYLDLGCGPGFHLCLLAAANPDAEFVGVDFQTDHIEHARGLADAAQLSNVRFIQADFLDLAADWPAELGTFDYIVLYGILSWVSAELRTAVFQCVDHGSKPGTLVAFGYNAWPGWLRGIPFQHMANEFARTRDAEGALEGAINMFRRLVNVTSPVSQQITAFKPQLDLLVGQPTSYLAHELLTDNWTPLWHSHVARELGPEFGYVASGTIAEALLPDSLPPELRAFVVEQDDQCLRQDVQDIVINQQFRRDIFCRNPRRAPKADLDADPLLYLFSAPQYGAPVQFKTTFGGLTVEYSAVADIVAALADGPKTVGELMALKSPVVRHTRSIILSMLDANMLVIGAASPGSAEIAQRCNAAVARAVTKGQPYHYTAAAVLGSGTPAGELDLLLLDTWLADPAAADEKILARGLAERLAALGRELKFQGAALAGEELHLQAVRIARLFLDQVVPKWRRLGVIA